MPSVPIIPSHIILTPEYDEHSPLELIHPLPVVTHPYLNAAQSSSVDNDPIASVHSINLQLVPVPPTHFPSDPFNNLHYASVPVYVLHYYNV